MKRYLRFIILVLAFVCLFGCSVGPDKPNDNTPNDNTNNENVNGNEDDNHNNDGGNHNDDGEDNGGDLNGEESTLVKVEIPDIKNATLSDAFKSFDLSYDKSLVEKKKNEIIEIIKNAKSVEEINKAYDGFSSLNEEIYDKYLVAETLYDADMSNKTIEKVTYDLYEMCLDIETSFEELEVEIAKSKYASDFFTGYTAEEIAEIASKEVDNDEYNTLVMKQKELQDSFYTASNKEKDVIMKTFIQNNKRIAVLEGYEENEYIKYSDINNYFRLYSAEEISNFETFVYDNLLDLADQLYYLNYKVSGDDKDKANDLMFKSFMDNIEFINGYVNAVGSDFLETYNNLFDHGYYIISNNRNANDTAYQDRGTNVALVFFGPSYQDTSTFVHEFGHYYTSTKGTDSYSYDLCEVHSQADEALIRLYFSNIDPSPASKYYEYRLVSSLLDGVIDGVMIREFEEEIYKDDVDSLQAVWNKINRKYNNFSGDNWYELFIDYDNYYISYATSAVGALAFYAYGKEQGFEKAKEAYLKLCSYDGYGDIEEAFAYAGLPNPLEEDTIKDIVTVIEYEMENSWK